MQCSIDDIEGEKWKEREVKRVGMQCKYSFMIFKTLL